MKICVISTTVMPVPLVGYGGLEQLAWQQACGLAEQGHKVMLVAPRGSSVPDGVELHETTLGESEHLAYSGYAEKLSDFDVCIDNSWNKFSYIGKIEQQLKIPVLGVLHAPVNTMYSSPPPLEKPCFVAISKDQAAATKEHLKLTAKVAYNGIDIDFYKPTKKPRSDRYLFLARMSTIKGPDIALQVAIKTKIGLDLVGDDQLTNEIDFLKAIRTQCVLTPRLRYIGPQSRENCCHWFNRGKALLHPNARFREPFGLAPVEAQLCGMPVIAFDNGAMRETVKHKETGFLVSSQEEMEMLVEEDAVSSINPKRCREWAVQFSFEKMIDRYEELCEEAIETGGW